MWYEICFKGNYWMFLPKIDNNKEKLLKIWNNRQKWFKNHHLRNHVDFRR